MIFAQLYSSISAGKDRVLARLSKDLQSSRSMWNYAYMLLYMFIVLYLTFTHADTCGNTIIVTTGGVVTGIFTNVVWSKTVERTAKGKTNGIPEPVTPSKEEAEAGD